jgi:hypothetical protein
MKMRVWVVMGLAWSLPCAAWDVRTDSEGDLVRWNRPVQLVLDERAAELIGDPLAEEAVRAAVKNFDAATPHLDVTLTVGPAAPLGFVSGQLNQNSIVALEDWPFSKTALAVTIVTLNARTNELLDADVAFNLSSHKFRVLEDSANEEQLFFDDVQNTITHEVGHVLSLMHNGAEPDLVMYPSAAPGEIAKRTLKQDDVDGLLALYGKEQPLFTCSSSGAAPWLLVLLIGLLRRSKRLALLALIPTAALADDLALVKVTARNSGAHSRNPGLIVTELSLSVVDCKQGSCAGLDRAVVPGGRMGDLEQVVVHEPVPRLGETILVTRSADGTVRVVYELGNLHEGAGVTHFE